MLLWVVLAVMTGLAALALLWPLSRRDGGLTSQASDIAIYKDQLAEIERDFGRGLIASGEAQAARVEVSRRLIEADARLRQRSFASVSSLHRRLASIVVLIVIPVISLGLYGLLGSPGEPDQPLVARLDTPPVNASIDDLVARAETKLAADPNNGNGWEFMAGIYVKMGRYQDAVQAYANALRLLGPTAEREANFGVAMVAAANGMVTSDAKSAFQDALKLDPKEFRANYFLGVAREQDGDKKGAADTWMALIPANPEAADFLRGEIARVDGKAPAPGPSQEDAAAASRLSPEERGKMIQGMVSGLASRLRSQGGTVEEWMRLIRAYSVLGRGDDARLALGDARKALASSADAGRQLDDLARTLGL